MAYPTIPRSSLALGLFCVFAGSAAAQIPMTPQEIATAARQSTVQIRALDTAGRVAGQGTGFFTSSDGVIVTNYHVIQTAHLLQVETLDGEVFDNVFYVTSDPRRDVAILKIPIEGAVTLRLGYDAAEVGSRVFVMGNPLGQTGTFSDGMVSAHRTIEGVSMLQITAPISPGSSGGPVMNVAGEVIGVATMMLVGGQNLNFAVPVQSVRPLLSTGERPQRFAASLLPRSSGGLARTSSAPEPPPSASRSAPMPRSSSRPSDRYEQQVLDLLATLEPVFTNNRFTRSHDIHTGALRRNRSEQIEIRLTAGRAYGIIGVCDVDCSDLDLRLYSPSGRLLESDLRVSDTPRLFFTAPITGMYAVRITMSGCSVEPCSFGMASYVAR